MLHLANTARRMTGRKLSHASSVSRRGTVAVYLDFGFFRFKQFSINAHSGYYYMRAEYITHVRNISISHSTSASQQGTHNKQRRPSHDSNAKSTLHFYPLKNVKSNACSRPFFCWRYMYQLRQMSGCGSQPLLGSSLSRVCTVHRRTKRRY